MINSAVCTHQRVFGCVSGWTDWISTGLYLCPGMKTLVTFPAEIVNKGWMVRRRKLHLPPENSDGALEL